MNKVCCVCLICNPSVSVDLALLSIISMLLLDDWALLVQYRHWDVSEEPHLPWGTHAECLRAQSYPIPSVWFLEYALIHASYTLSETRYLDMPHADRNQARKQHRCSDARMHAAYVEA